MFTHTIDPTILSLGPLEIRWYGLMYVLGFLVTYFYVRSAIRKGKLKLTEKEFDNLLGLLVVGLIIGARIFYILFYNPQYFIAYPWKVFFVWEGGLSFHGGLVGLLLVGWIYAREKKISFLRLADLFCVPLALANAFGRMGNFINGELYGIATTLPWAVVFPGVQFARHPTQLYEVAYNVLIFLILFKFRDKNWKPGTLVGLFMILYSIFRFSVEFVKDLPAYGPLTMGQWLTIPVFLIGIFLVWKVNKK